MSKCSTLSLILSKGVVIALNLFFIFLAVCMHSFATAGVNVLTDYGKDPVRRSMTAYVLNLIVCVYLIMTSLFGCLGIVKGNVKLLHTYIILLSAYMVLQWIILAVYVSVQRFGYHPKVMDWLEKDFYSNATETADASHHEQMWDIMQADYECCGFDGPEDYAAIKQPIKKSCCQKTFLARTDIPKDNMYRICVRAEFYYKFGCRHKVMNILRSNDKWGFKLIVIGFWFQATDMLLSMYVANRIKNTELAYKLTDK